MTAPDQENVATLIRRRVIERGAHKTVCPSEIARVLAGDGGDWRSRMAEVHDAVDALASAGEVVLSWRGIRMSVRQGPYRIGLPE